MAKLKFKCKRELEKDKLCGRFVYAKMHRGISTAVEIDKLLSEIKELKSKKLDTATKEVELEKLDSVPIVPRDWVFTLTCSLDHEEDYTYDEHEK